MVHSYYAVMGGITIDDTNISLFNPNRYTGFSLTRQGIRWIAKNAQDVLPDLSAGEIWDRSKASAIAKTVVCLQAIWFCAQCVGRLSQGYSITLLELNTFIHALCALATYMLWWNKPLDVESRTQLQGTFSREISAVVLLICNSEVNEFVKKVQKGALYYRTSCHSMASAEPTRDSDPNPIPKAKSHPGYKHHRSSRIASWWTDLRMPATDYSVYTHLNRKELETLAIAKAEVLRRFNLDAREVHLTVSRLYDGQNAPTHPEMLLNLRMPNWYNVFNNESELEWNLASHTYSLSFTGLFYGGLHLIAWNAPFPNHIQRLLWRMSGIYLATSVPVLIIIMELIEKSQLDALLSWVKVMLFAFLLLTLSAMFMYLFCRVYLVVECFLSLSHLPDSVFDVPQWSQYIPHIG